MAFGLIHWLASFIIFLTVLSIITWSAVHLSMKDQNSTDIVMRFLDMDDYVIARTNETTSSTTAHDSTSRVMESTDGPTLFANHQGLEVSNSAEFYKILQALSSTPNQAVNSTQDDIATMMSSVASGDTTWNEDTRNTAYEISDTSLALGNHWNISWKIQRNRTNNVPRITQPTTTDGAKFFDMDVSWKSDSHQAAKMGFSDFLQGNETSNTSVSFLFGRASSGAEQLNATKFAETTRSVETLYNERLETPTISPYFYITLHITENP